MFFDVTAILFDIDGTLVDSTPVVERTWRTWAAKRGMDAEAILRVCHGRRSEDTIADLLPPSERDEAIAELAHMELTDLDDVTALPSASTSGSAWWSRTPPPGWRLAAPPGPARWAWPPRTTPPSSPRPP